ncbi:hypothetical protein FNF29_06464 [Cafeteria roenbergensis]|uniref:Uncharacterized protein n=1 Tax=Cafeteria roenbergensis TaxID=33653 RepID=A0A5A8C8D4_CAFRO|nr:hypothetical protein FNF29_06464 [Cafeteria roenbergensis]|eukprot:KAA0148839.1 hypothetical protein FNF29_06464 [Cafeteria roenbergensis]
MDAGRASAVAAVERSMPGWSPVTALPPISILEWEPNLELVELVEVPGGYGTHVSELEAVIPRILGRATPVALETDELSDESAPVLVSAAMGCPGLVSLAFSTTNCDNDVSGWAAALVAFLGKCPRLARLRAPVCYWNSVFWARPDVRAAIRSTSVRWIFVDAHQGREVAALCQDVAANPRIKGLDLSAIVALNAEGWDAVLSLLRSPVGPELVCLHVDKLKSRQAEDLARLIREPEARPVELRLSLRVPLSRLGESTRSVMKALRDTGWPRRFQFFRVCSCSDDMAAMIAESVASGQAECVCMAQCDLSAAAITAIAAALPRCPGLRQLNLDNDPMTEPAAVSLIEAMLGLPEARLAVALKGVCGCVTSAAGQERLLELLSSTGHRGLRLGGLIEGTKDMPEPLRSAAARRTALQRSWDGSWGARREVVLWRRAMEGRR